jgi:hypothetical protein
VKSYVTKPKKLCEISSKFQPPNIITTHIHSFKTITRFSFYFPSFSQLLRPIILFLLKKLVGTSIFKIELKLCPGKETNFHDPSLPFKEKEKGGEGRSPLGGQWKEKEKVPMRGGQWKEKEKVPMLGGQWNVPSLVANGR